MRFVVDSDVFLHDLLHTDRAEEARYFIDKYGEEIATTALNIMEISSVLSRKYHWKKGEIEDAIKAIKESLVILIPTEYDIIDAMEIAAKYYLTPIDAIMLLISKIKNLTLVTFDNELLSFQSKSFDVKTPSDAII